MGGLNLRLQDYGPLMKQGLAWPLSQRANWGHLINQ